MVLRSTAAVAIRRSYGLFFRLGSWFGSLPQPNVTIGRHSYGLRLSTVAFASHEAPVSIGSFCSIAPGVQIISHAGHEMRFPSMWVTVPSAPTDISPLIS